jgi:hypothetical protein
MPNVQAIPASRVDSVPVSEREEYDAFRRGDANLREKGIMDVPNPYDPEAGSRYPKTERPSPTYGPLLATDEGQPSDVGSPVVIGRQPAVDRSEQLDKPSGRVVRSKK